MDPINKNHRIVYIVLTILLTSGVIGGSVYYVLNKQNKEQQKQIEADVFEISLRNYGGFVPPPYNDTLLTIKGREASYQFGSSTKNGKLEENEVTELSNIIEKINWASLKDEYKCEEKICAVDGGNTKITVASKSFNKEILILDTPTPKELDQLLSLLNKMTNELTK